MSKDRYCDICGQKLRWYDIFGSVVHDAPKPMKIESGPTIYTYGNIRLCAECALKNKHRPYAFDAKAYELRGTNIYE